MVYNETHIGTTTTVNELIILLCNENIPRGATVDVAASCHYV